MENLNAEQVISELRKNDSCYAEDIKAIRNAIALITSQEQRIKELGKELGVMRATAEGWRGHSKTLEGENEKLKNLVDKCFDTENALNEKVKELTEENERLRCVGIPDYEVYIRLSDAKHAIMDYIGEQTVSKYVSEAECKAARGGAEGAMNELDYLTPAKVAPIADTVRKMRERLKADAITIKDHTGKIGVVVGVGNIDDVAREMLEGEQ